jgi:hypothetical protein
MTWKNVLEYELLKVQNALDSLYYLSDEHNYQFVNTIALFFTGRAFN